ncbi:MAG TPA: hypothetical protein VFQ39_06340 [Longimicrobium sp.]|nr:hypothetical protein [Longimicrobium sp.]
MRRMWALVAIPALWIALAAPSTPPLCAICVTQSDAVWFYERHAFGGRSGVMMDCSAFNSCHPDWQPLDCFDRHYQCPSVLAPREAEAVLAAAERGDGAMVRAAVARHPKALRYDVGRRYLQVLGCGGEVVAQARMRDVSSFAE